MNAQSAAGGNRRILVGLTQTLRRTIKPFSNAKVLDTVSSLCVHAIS